MTSTVRENHIEQFDGLRTLAVAAVAWSHWAPASLRFSLPWGTGVQLFFVLSGFLITGILLDNKRDSDGGVFFVWRRFYIRRCLRIFPLFYMTLIGALLINLAPIRQTWPWHFSYLSNFYYYGTGQAGLDQFLHFWSLAVEEQFYLAWPFIVLLLPSSFLKWLFPVLILLGPLSRIFLHGIAPDASTLHYLPVACLDALGLGGLFAFLSRSSGYLGLNVAPRLALTGLVVGPLGALASALSKHFYGPNAVIDAFGHLSLVLFYGWVIWTASTGFPGIAGRILSCRPLAYLGKISYGLYVFHLLTGSLLLRIASPLHLTALVEGSFVVRLVAQTGMTIGLAAISWHIFEKPLNDLKRFFPYKAKVKVTRDKLLANAAP